MIGRTHNCGELRVEHTGQNVVLHGWISGLRDTKTIFVVLRDRYGIVQVTIDESCSSELFAVGKELSLEYTVEVRGVVRKRGDFAINAKMDTGEIEIVPESIEILSKTKPLPFKIDSINEKPTEETRLKYRYLDLRQSNLQHTMRIRHKTALVVRNIWISKTD